MLSSVSRMALGSFIHGALADLSSEDLDRMLELDESLFVEHKSDLGAESAFLVIRSVAAFANTFGGWVLIGVKDGRPNGAAERWADSEKSPTLVDAVRDRLRGEIDPLPAFEAKVITHRDGPVGVVRVYESTDTPHILVSTGAVYVRDVATDVDVSTPKRPGAGLRGERAYRAAQIRSRGQLLDLASRGREASERVGRLLDPMAPIPLITTGLGLTFEITAGGAFQPRHTDRASVVLKLAPYTRTPRFRGWATTAEGSAAVLRAAENLADIHGLAPSWLEPDPAGASVSIGGNADPRHTDALGNGLATMYRVVLDGAGIVGAAFELGLPSLDDRRTVRLDALARTHIRPVIEAAASILVAGEFLGRARCHIDLVRLGTALTLEDQVQTSGAAWVPVEADLALPILESEVDEVALLAAYAYGRSARLHAWDRPPAS